MNICPTYSILQRLIHEVFSPAEAHCTIASTGMQPKNNVSIHTATESTPKADGKPINRLQTVCEVTAIDDKKLKLQYVQSFLCVFLHFCMMIQNISGRPITLKFIYNCI